jgi:hypothetical protein
MQGSSGGVLLACSDGEEYVVKGHHLGRVVVNEQVVGHLGKIIGAPVGDVRIVEVPRELIAINGEMSHMQPGVSHGSLSLLPEVVEDRQGIAHYDLPANRLRFALLAVLYGWVQSSDEQYFYRKSPPHLVYSFDHGHFFCGGPGWTLEQLSHAGRAQPCASIMSTCAISSDELTEALKALDAVTAPLMAEAVSAPPEPWSITFDERIAVAQYLHNRRADLLASAPAS